METNDYSNSDNWSNYSSIENQWEFFLNWKQGYGTLNNTLLRFFFNFYYHSKIFKLVGIIWIFAFSKIRSWIQSISIIANWPYFVGTACFWTPAQTNRLDRTHKAPSVQHSKKSSSTNLELLSTSSECEHLSYLDIPYWSSLPSQSLVQVNFEDKPRSEFSMLAQLWFWNKILNLSDQIHQSNNWKCIICWLTRVFLFVISTIWTFFW